MNKQRLLTIVFFVISVTAFGQKETIDDIGTALGAGSAKELIKYCVNRVEIQIDGNQAVYSKPQAEVILRDFFNQNVSKGFRYVHQGSSPEGLKYTIGNYAVEDGSYRVYMLLKKTEDDYQIDTISFTRE